MPTVSRYKVIPLFVLIYLKIKCVNLLKNRNVNNGQYFQEIVFGIHECLKFISVN